MYLSLGVKTNMSEPKRHHFVPCAYLEGFKESNSGFLNIYSKRSGTWRRQKAKQAMFRKKYYKQYCVPEDVDENILEKKLGSGLEPKGLNSLKRLVHCANELRDDDIANIIAYVEFQRIRVPRQIDEATRLAKQAIAIMGVGKSTGKKGLKTHKNLNNDSFRLEFMKLVFGKFGPYFSRMIWEIVEASEGSWFITSDSPVSFWNQDFMPPLEPGIGLYGTVVFFPIDSGHLLILRHPEYMDETKGSSEKLPKNLDFEDGEIEIRRGVVWDSEVVDDHNRIMFMLSQDTIAGCSKACIDAAVGEETSGHQPSS